MDTPPLAKCLAAREGLPAVADPYRHAGSPRARGSRQSVDAPSSMSERFVTDGHLRLSGRIDARTSATCSTVPIVPVAQWLAGTQQVRHCPREGMSRNTRPLKIPAGARHTHT